MIIRYTNDIDGKRKKTAEIYTDAEHGIRPESIDPDAAFITRKLRKEGFEAYVVGGAVRDLLVGVQPKDFDIVTNALPRQIKKVFWNSRIIGKRFRLVHIHFGEKIFEVSTFRTNQPGYSNNVYGTIEEDVLRRDFTINALYYDPQAKQIVDYVGAMDDIRRKRIVSLLPLADTFREDPVRILRALKYTVATGFRIESKLKKELLRSGSLLGTASSSRMTEELFKIIESGRSEPLFALARKFRVLSHILPGIVGEWNGEKDAKGWARLKDTAGRVDAIAKNAKQGGKPAGRGILLGNLLADFIHLEEHTEEPVHFCYKEAKRILLPFTPPNVEIETAVKVIFELKGLKFPGRKRLHPPHAAHPAHPHHPAAKEGADGQPRKRRRRRYRGKKKTPAVEA